MQLAARRADKRRAGRLRLDLHLAVQGEQRHWQADLLGAPPDGPRHFSTLPDLIRWLAQLEWQTSATPGLK